MSLYKRGENYSYRFMIRGMRYSGKTHTNDRRAALAVETAVRSRIALHLAGIGEKESHRFDEAADLYLAHLTERRSKNYIANVRSALAYWRYVLTDVDIETITRDDFAKFVTTLLHHKQAAGTINLRMQVLKGVLRHAQRQGWIEHLPDTTGLVLQETPRERIYDDDEIKRLLAACDHPMTRDVVILALLTGCRREELVGLKWIEIDMSDREIHLPAARCKSRKPRTVPLSPMAVEVLMRQPGRGTNERVWPLARIDRQFKNAMTEAEITGGCFHDLRRTVISRLHKLGCAEATIKKLVGHSAGANVTQKYYTIIEITEIRAIVEMLEKSFPLQSGGAFLPQGARKLLSGKE